MNGHAEVGFVRSGVLEALTREDKLDMVRVKVIHQQTLPTFPFASSTRLYPGWPVAVTRQFSERMDRQLAVALLSLALDAVLLFRQFGAAGLYHYGGFVLSSVLLGLVFLSLAVLLSVVTRERTRASGLAIALWFGFVVVFDLLMLGLRVACGGEFGGAALAYVLLLNPTDIFRILNIFSLDQMRTLYGLTSIVPPALASPWLMGSAMLVWIALPLTLASWRFRP